MPELFFMGKMCKCEGRKSWCWLCFATVMTWTSIRSVGRIALAHSRNNLSRLILQSATTVAGIGLGRLPCDRLPTNRPQAHQIKVQHSKLSARGACSLAEQLFASDPPSTYRAHSDGGIKKGVLHAQSPSAAGAGPGAAQTSLLQGVQAHCSVHHSSPLLCTAGGCTRRDLVKQSLRVTVVARPACAATVGAQNFALWRTPAAAATSPVPGV